jgi:hypothetical protein
MKKNEAAPYVLAFYILLIIIYFFSCGCKTLYVGSKYTSCPSNDKTFWYKRMNVKPTKQYLKFKN